MTRSDSPATTHFNAAGHAHMVDVTGKPITPRLATASSTICMTSAAADQIRAGNSCKGDVLGVARIAAIGAVKLTSTLIPLCHAIPIEGVEVDFEWLSTNEQESAPQESLRCLVTVQTTSKTGVEMEALAAASVAALTVYDMLKSVDRSMTITDTRLDFKSGGKSGTFSRD